MQFTLNINSQAHEWKHRDCPIGFFKYPTLCYLQKKSTSNIMTNRLKVKEGKKIYPKKWS